MEEKRKSTMKTYYERIRGLREDNDMTQQEIADILGTSQTMYARYERGANELPIRHLKALCELYNISADYILGISADDTRERGRVPVKKCGDQRKSSNSP